MPEPQQRHRQRITACDANQLHRLMRYTSSNECLHRFRKGPSAALERHVLKCYASKLNASLNVRFISPHPIGIWQAAGSDGCNTRVGELQ